MCVATSIRATCSARNVPSTTARKNARQRWPSMVRRPLRASSTQVGASGCSRLALRIARVSCVVSIYSRNAGSGTDGGMEKVSRTIAVRQQQPPKTNHATSPNKVAAKLKAAAKQPVKTNNKFELADVFATSRLRELQKNTKSSACKVKPAVKPAGDTLSNQGESSPTKPRSTGAFKVRPIEKTKFRYFYDRADLPLRVNFSGAVRKVQWQVDITQIDYTHYLPLFFEGLRELDEPYRFLALNGTMDMLEKGGDRPLACIPHLVIPIKQNLMTRHPTILCIQMKVLQKLVLSCPYAGEALVPYYRQILTIFNLFVTKRVNCGDAIDYGQRRDENLGDLIIETLYILERHGGEDAFVNIKYMVPTYESCMA
ncbi:hypothetical protein H310_05249 [Aphanomyces invadans]|uniref:Uncharacterized protein n=1 Tax=Aphanomyces invadans TaxID=157072 RepID=A0A024U945_9STRA|nr:hypothetical protein H310_05249 [Aphanomyces invadans]ETW02750.1 hypothetical protein H310_05249 [Aphanomyces invadans]|eukprot:XP_008868134.1 hypothetical protein H310_05249 [Aphanomyces invadans]